jgi:hypothetical protein
MSPIRVRWGISRAVVLLALLSFQSLADVTSLVVDPQSTDTVYAGTSEGGVLKSTDGGATWVSAGLTDTPVIALAIDPGVPSWLYAISSTGLHKSSNAGATWIPIYTNGSIPFWQNIDKPFVWTVGTLALARRTDPALPATVHVGVTYTAADTYMEFVWGDIFTSTNGGEGWTGALYNNADPFAGPWTSAPIMAAAAQTDTTPATLYASVHPGAYGYQICGLPDGSGCTRIDQSSEEPAVLAVDPHNQRVVYAGMKGTGVYKSTDAGHTWSGSGSGVVRALVLDPITPGTVFAAIEGQGVLKSTDGAATWTDVSAGLEPNVRALAIDPITPAVLYAATVSGVFKSTDGGESWNPTSLTQGLQSVNVPLGLIGGTAGTGTVTLNAPAPAGGAVVALSSSNPALASVPASVTVPAGETSASFPISTALAAESAVVTITATLSGLAKSASLEVGPPIAYMLLSGWPVVGGMTVSGSVVFGVPAPADGATVTLTSSDPAVAAVPVTTTAAAGARTAGFPIWTAVVSADTVVTIRATYAGDTRSMIIKVVPAAVSALTLHPTRVFAGSSSTGSVTLMAPAPPGGAVVNLGSSDTSVATVPATVTVPAGATSASFTVSTNTVLPPTYSQIAISIGASAGGASISQTLLVALPEATLSSLTLSPPSIGAGGAGVGTVLLNAAAPAGGATVALSSSNPPVATVPASVTVPMGATSANFPIATVACTSGSATVSGTYSGVTQSAALNVISSADYVAIGQAAYFKTWRLLRVSATSTDPSAVLRVYVTSSGTLIGTLSNLGGGRYSGQFPRSANPKHITVRSSSCGSASAAVSSK